MKRITRRQARAWLEPMRSCLRQIRATGEADTIRGYAHTRLHDFPTACKETFVSVFDPVCLHAACGQEVE